AKQAPTPPSPAHILPPLPRVRAPIPAAAAARADHRPLAGCDHGHGPGCPARRPHSPALAGSHLSRRLYRPLHLVALRGQAPPVSRRPVRAVATRPPPGGRSLAAGHRPDPRRPPPGPRRNPAGRARPARALPDRKRPRRPGRVYDIGARPAPPTPPG